MRHLIAPLIVVPFVLGAVPALAQSNPSAEQIINSLKPSGNLLNSGTRGIRLAPPPAATAVPQAPTTPVAMPVPQPRPTATRPTSAAARAPAAPAQAQTPAGPSVNLTVNFATGSADLTPQAIATLNELGRALTSTDLASYHFRIEGHTDTVGSPDYNLSLSKRRAEAVVSYLESKFGVQPARLQAVGMGEQGLLVQTPPQTAEPRNRRVQVINLGA